MTDLSTGGVSKYHRLATQLRRDIDAGRYRPGDQLPSESQLVERFGVSQPTVRAAIGVLRAEGIVEAIHGRGTFVRQRRPLQRIPRTHSASSGQPPYEVTHAGRVPAPEHIAELMGIAPGVVVVVRRHTLSDDTGKPTGLAASYLPLTVAAGTSLEQLVATPEPLTLCVEQLAGRRFATARERLTARMPTVEEATALGIGPGNPVIRVLHAAYDDHHEVLEVTDTVWAADRVELTDDYDIPTSAPTQRVTDPASAKRALDDQTAIR